MLTLPACGQEQPGSRVSGANPFGNAAPRDEAAYDAKKAAERAARADDRKKEQDDRQKNKIDTKPDTKPETPGGNWRDNAAPAVPRGGGRGAGGADRVITVGGGGPRTGGDPRPGGPRDGAPQRGAEKKVETKPPPAAAAKAPRTVPGPKQAKPAKPAKVCLLPSLVLSLSRLLFRSHTFHTQL